MSTSNTYEKLSDEEDQESNADNIKNKYETKSPPIFPDGVENIAPLKQALDGVAKDQYVIKILRDNQDTTINNSKVSSDNGGS